MSGRFETWAKQWRIGWNGVYGQAFLGAAAAILGDRMERWGVYAARQRLPEYAEPANARRICYERGIEPGPLLSDALVGQLGRCAATLNRYRGTPLGMITALHFAGFEGAVCVQQNGLGYQNTATPNLAAFTADLETLPSWVTRTVLATNPEVSHAWFTFDQDNAFTSRFAILFPSTVADPGLGTTENLNRLRRVVVANKPAKATCLGVWVSSAGWLFDWPFRTFAAGYTFADHAGTSVSYSVE